MASILGGSRESERQETRSSLIRMVNPELSVSGRYWVAVREFLRRHRHDLTAAAAAEYPPAARVAGTPLLARPAWLPDAPIRLPDVQLSFQPQAAEVGGAALDPAVVPDGYLSYARAMRELAPPAVFENRVTYRLLDADLAGWPATMGFGLGRYFDGINAGEAAAHEFAAARFSGSGLSDPAGGLRASVGDPLRASVGDPLDLGRRPVNLAISTLTVRLCRRTGQATFLLHWRDPALVGHAGGMYQVIPVGVFQPSEDVAGDDASPDFSLWHSIMREYAEELAGHDEVQGPVDYASWPFASQLTAACDSGRIRSWCLGLGVDPLSYAADLLTVVVIDEDVFTDLFGAGVAGAGNSEGRVLAPRPFTEAVVARTVERDPLQAAGAAVLRLAWTHRAALLQ